MIPTQMLSVFTNDQLLDELASRGLDARELYDQLGALVEYAHKAECDNDGPWPSEYTEGEAAFRAWENPTAKPEFNANAFVAACMDVARETGLVVGREPTDDELSAFTPDGIRGAVKAYKDATFLSNRGTEPVVLHLFQCMGTSSRDVAHALRLGFIAVEV